MPLQKTRGVGGLNLILDSDKHVFRRCSLEVGAPVRAQSIRWSPPSRVRSGGRPRVRHQEEGPGFGIRRRAERWASGGAQRSSAQNLARCSFFRVLWLLRSSLHSSLRWSLRSRAVTAFVTAFITALVTAFARVHDVRHTALVTGLVTALVYCVHYVRHCVGHFVRYCVHYVRHFVRYCVGVLRWCTAFVNLRSSLHCVRHCTAFVTLRTLADAAAAIPTPCE